MHFTPSPAHGGRSAIGRPAGQLGPVTNLVVRNGRRQTVIRADSSSEKAAAAR
jgi:hypothetical protein